VKNVIRRDDDRSMFTVSGSLSDVGDVSVTKTTIFGLG
jgi:hypothetical protein